MLAERERAVAYSREDAFEAACVALCEAPASKLQAKPPMSEHFVSTTKLEPWLRRELSISDTIRKRLLDKNQCDAFLAKVATAERNTGTTSGNVFDAKNARILLKHVLKTKYKEKPPPPARVAALARHAPHQVLRPARRGHPPLGLRHRELAG